MAEIKVNMYKDRSYLISDMINTNGMFEVLADLKNWKEDTEINNNRYPELIEVRLFNVHENVHCSLTKINYCQSNRQLEIHVEMKRDERNTSHKLDYVVSHEDQLLFTNDSTQKIEVKIWIYNNDSNKPENVYQICGKTSTQDLEFGRNKNNLSGFSPEHKKGNILVGG